ncbi:DUF3558 family protein [Saccharopolyspora sp. NPDC000359]|uniref:DUF3558 family protein n=1 Tax=Saccharopolyspora sp. NPDC000359 TaxID=3154251 RepID=UPI003328C357
MNTTRTTLTAAAGMLILGLAGCANSTPGVPEPTTGGETTSAATDPFHIEQPKNLKAISDPCQLLTQQQLQELGAGGEPKPGESQWKQSECTWQSQQLTVTVSPDTIQGQGLRYTAKIVADGEPTAEVSGYPAVHVGATSGSCGTYVGTSDTELFYVDFSVGTDGRSNPEFSDACAAADRIAGMVIENLPPA